MQFKVGDKVRFVRLDATARGFSLYENWLANKTALTVTALGRIADINVIHFIAEDGYASYAHEGELELINKPLATEEDLAEMYAAI